MRILINRFIVFSRLLIPVISILLLFLFSQEVTAQEPPPHPLEITVVQNLGFGAFTHGVTGGTISISSSGFRSSTVSVIPLNLGYPFSAAGYHLVANRGTLITILNVPGVPLNGSNGGSMTLHIITPPQLVINTDPPDFTLLNIGGTLEVGNTASNPPGNYDGFFDIIFIQE